MQFSHCYLFHHESAGQQNSSQSVAQVLPILASQYQTVISKKTSSPEELIEQIVSITNTDAIYLLGGDGTLHQAIQALQHVDSLPPIGILPGGTCNDFSRVLSIPQTLEKATEALINGRIESFDLAKANSSYFLNFAGLGFITHASDGIEETKKEKLGKISYFLSAIKTMKESETFSGKLTIDDQVIEFEAAMILVMNGFSIGTHTFPVSTISPQDGELDIFVFPTTSIGTVLKWIQLGYKDSTNSFQEDRSILHLKGENVSILTNESLSVDMDGEIHEETPLTIQLQKASISLIVPSTYQ
ncbi:diacylglycerol/lipid kinase family protein [Paenisporosarcina cavernae]|uniref:diacylglycerol/lipid kinase family protein n=1 Tax=Paenisporosarcina cavernae TaxID=2320858 RepID=UPI0013C536A2|nr:YegS/Rv2252/BmrU family lipid kinase [Paenisporosarcina cavernae]